MVNNRDISHAAVQSVMTMIYLDIMSLYIRILSFSIYQIRDTPVMSVSLKAHIFFTGLCFIHELSHEKNVLVLSFLICKFEYTIDLYG